MKKIFLIIIFVTLASLPAFAEQIAGGGYTINYALSNGGYGGSFIAGQSTIGTNLGLIYAFQSPASTGETTANTTGNTTGEGTTGNTTGESTYEAFALISPANNATLETASVNFSWSASSEYASFDVYITDKDSNSQTTKSSSTKSLTQSLNDGLYSWSVVGKTSGGSQAQTSSNNFTVNSAGPTITASSGGKTLQSNSVVSASAKIELSFSDAVGINASSIKVLIDGSASGAKVSSQSASGKTASASAKLSLAEGKHTIEFQASDLLGKTSVATLEGITSYSGTLRLLGTPMNYPNPFKPAAGQSTTLVYSLSDSAEIKIMIFDITGKLVWQNNYSSGSTGGSAGENEISWNGKSFTGDNLGNGAYIYVILSSGKKLGQGEIAIYD